MNGREESPMPFSQVECGNNTQDYTDALVQVSQGYWEQVLVSARQYTSYRKQEPLRRQEKKPSIRAQIPAGKSTSRCTHTSLTTHFRFVNGLFITLALPQLFAWHPTSNIQQFWSTFEHSIFNYWSIQHSHSLTPLLPLQL